MAILISGFGENDIPTKREALVFEKNGQVKIVNTNHQAYDPLMYPLMFPSGQLGWAPNTIPLTLDREVEEKITDIFSEENDEEDDIQTLINQDLITEDQTIINHDLILDENLSNQTSNHKLDEPTENYTQAPIQSNNKKMKFVSAMQYYQYLLCDRPGNHLIYFGRLFHQFIVDQFSKIELGRLNFFRFNQDKIRADKYQKYIKS